MIRSAFLGLATAATVTALPALAEVPRVITDIPVVASLVQQVMGDLGQPEVLLQAGGDPHHYQLRPSQARGLQKAGLLIWVGPELTPWLTQAASGADVLTLLNLPETQRRSFAGGGDGDGDEHEHEHEHDEAGHRHSATDPHAWLDPENGQAWLQAIAAALSRRDPEHAAAYGANADHAAGEIATLDADLSAALTPLQNKRFVVFHDAYGYFTSHYRLSPAIAVSLGDASAPSAAQMRAIQSRISAEPVTCAFPEANHDPRLLAAVTEGSGVRQGAALDPEGSTLTQGAGLYTAILRDMGKSLVDCLGEN